jgi:hypothetical protein
MAAFNSFDMYDKALDIVDQIFGEEITEKYFIRVVNGVCRILLPLSVPLTALSNRDDVSINFAGDFTVVAVH